MKPWHLMILGLVVWLGLGALGLRWVLWPYWWHAQAHIGPPIGVEMLRRVFPVRLAPLPDPVTPRTPADDEEFEKDEENLVTTWIWRETLRRFLLFFSLWMASGWFVHWLTTRIIYGPQRWRGQRQ